jgi:hypothetical protein
MASTDRVEEDSMAKGRGGDEKQRTWARRIEAWRRSGEKQAFYCRRHGLKRDQFVYWKRRLEELVEAATNTPAIELVEVPWRRTTSGANGLTAASGIVVVAAGWRVELEADFDEEALRRVLGVLQASL